MSKNNIKLIVGLSIAAAATTALVIGVVRELKAIRNLTIDIDELPEEPGDIADEEEQEHTKPDFIEDDKDAAIIYADANLPDGVNLQQVVLGFDYCTPVAGSISSYFGYRKNPVGASDRFHYGLDIAAEEEAEIVSFADGVVTVAAESSSYGKYIIVNIFYKKIIENKGNAKIILLI